MLGDWVDQGVKFCESFRIDFGLKDVDFGGTGLRRIEHCNWYNCVVSMCHVRISLRDPGCDWNCYHGTVNLLIL